MKKLLVIVFTFFTSMMFVNAATFKTTMSGNSTINEKGEITITVGVSNATNLYGFSAPITYDASKIKLTNSTGLNGFGVAVGTKIVVDASSGVTGSKSVAKLTFKALDGFKVGDSTTITIGGAEGSDGESIMTGSGSTFKVTVEKTKNSNNYLKSLSLSEGSISFNKNTTDYKVTVDNSVSSITITAEVEDEGAKVTGDGKKNLDLYSNYFSVVVTAENGAKKTYNITVNRKDKDGNIKELSNENNLEDLTIEGFEVPFKSDVLEYTILLKNSNSLDIKTKATGSGSSVTINNNSDFKKGNNIVEVVVTAENGSTKTYKINAILLDETETKPDTSKEEKTTTATEKKNSPILIGVVITETIIILSGAAYLLLKKN